MIFPLVQDFAAALDAIPSHHPRRRILSLLDEAIRRDAHFIDRHPTTLFQCTWNSCWWYDAPEAAAYYELPPGGSPTPVREASLAAVVETWRRTKEGTAPGFRWVRSLRPPAVPIGTPERLVLGGYKKEVTGVAFSPDGTLIAGASKDRTIRVWDVVTGAQVHCLEGHGRAVEFVAFTPDGGRLVSADSDTLRVWHVATGAGLLDRPLPRLTYRIGGLSPDGTTVLLDCGDADQLLSNRRIIRVQDVVTAAERHHLVREDNLNHLAFAADG